MAHVKAPAADADICWVSRRRRAYRPGALATAALLLGLVPVLVIGPTGAAATGAGPGTQAESAAQARAEAHEAAERLAELQPKVERAVAAYGNAVAGISRSISRGVWASQQADEAAAAAKARQDQLTTQVRALYMSGGATALMASVLRADSANDAMRRIAYVQRLVSTTRSAANDQDDVAAAGQQRAETLGAQADLATVRAADVMRRYDRMTAALAEATAVLDQLSDKARNLTEAAAAAAALQATSADAAAAAAARIATAEPIPIPRDFKHFYVGAAKMCHGLSWTVLAAVGQVESGHGRNPATSYAGAQGPMQFLPSTFAAYAVDGDDDGDSDIGDPADAIYTAAHYLCANGAGKGDTGLHNALWHYNHAEWYVQLVLKLAGQLAGKTDDDDGGLSGGAATHEGF